MKKSSVALTAGWLAPFFKLSVIGTRLSAWFFYRKVGIYSLTGGYSSIRDVLSDRRVLRQVRFFYRKVGYYSHTDGDSSIGYVLSDRRVQRQVSCVSADILAYLYFLFAEDSLNICFVFTEWYLHNIILFFREFLLVNSFEINKIFIHDPRYPFPQ